MLPSGTVTFLFSDIVGSTGRWEENPAAMEITLAAHNRVLDEIFREFHGQVFKTVGDEYCVAFESAENAIQSADAIHLRLSELDSAIQVRIGIHTGTIQPNGSDYFGPPVNKVARIQAAAKPGQTLLTDSTKGLLKASTAMADQGTHVLKDLLEPTRLWQLGPGIFGPIRSVGSTPNNLPIQSTSFIGRAQDLARMEQLLSKGRLITLTGSAGTGKTRLSLQFAAENEERFPDGVWFCELAALPDRDDVARELAMVLQVPDSDQSPVARVVSDLKTKSCLIVLDNCEHVLESASQLAEAILGNCPGVTLLATSREPLSARGESVFRVPSLEIPRGVATLSKLAKFSSTALFLDRLGAAAPAKLLSKDEAATVVRICERLDGIPLAIELAASRSRSMGLDQIEKRLGDRFRLLTGGNRNALSRQQTLRALIDWSVRLLDDREKDLFFDLSVFSDGWDMEAAEKVCVSQHRGIDEWDVVDLLTSLVDKSLVVFDQSSKRYRLLESMRQYAQEQLDSTPRTPELRNQHALHYLSIGADFKSADPDVRNESAARFTGNYENFRSAIKWFSSDPERANLALIALQQSVMGFDHLSRIDELLNLFDPLIQDKPAEISDRDFEMARAAYLHSLVVNRDVRAASFLEAATARYPNLSSSDKEIWSVRLPYSLFYMGKFGDAQSFCTGAIGEEGALTTTASLYQILGNCLFCLDEYKAAEAAFRTAWETAKMGGAEPRTLLVCGCGAVASCLFDNRLQDALQLALEVLRTAAKFPASMGFVNQALCAFDQLACEVGETWYLALRYALHKINRPRRLYMFDPFDLKLDQYMGNLTLMGSTPELFEAASRVEDISFYNLFSNEVASLKVEDFYGETKYFPGTASLPPRPDGF